MRVLVTGGSGHLGGRLARRLVAEGADVRVTYRPGDTTRALDGLAVDHRPAELLDDDALARALEGVETVFHTAALVTFDPRRYAAQMAVNAEGTRRLLTALRRAGVRRLVHTSTVNTLGVPRRGALGDEGTPSDWAPYRLGYMDSKRAAEDAVLAAARDGLHAVIVLPGTMFGPGDVHGNAGAWVQLVARAPVVPVPPGGTTVCHVDDAAEGHVLALGRGRPGRRYVLGGDPLSYRELFVVIAQALGRRVPMWDLPAPLLRLATAAIGRPGLARPLTEGLFYGSERAARELGWSWRPAVAAVHDAVAWYRAEGVV